MALQRMPSLLCRLASALRHLLHCPELLIFNDSIHPSFVSHSCHVCPMTPCGLVQLKVC